MEERPGGDVDSTEGRSSLRRYVFRWEKGSLVGSMLFACSGGSSIEERMACLWASVSDIQSCIGVNNEFPLHLRDRSAPTPSDSQSSLSSL